MIKKQSNRRSNMAPFQTIKASREALAWRSVWNCPGSSLTPWSWFLHCNQHQQWFTVWGKAGPRRHSFITYCDSPNPPTAPLLFWHLGQVYWRRQWARISSRPASRFTVCNLRGGHISIVNQTKQRLCQRCKHAELNLPQFTARSPSANSGRARNQVSAQLQHLLSMQNSESGYHLRRTTSRTVSTVSPLQRV